MCLVHCSHRKETIFKQQNEKHLVHLEVLIQLEQRLLVKMKNQKECYKGTFKMNKIE
jgi:hypothetical protein